MYLVTQFYHPVVMLCSTGLHAFEHEGIQNITLLKDQLVTASHDQTPAILKRHADVIARYDTNSCLSLAFSSFIDLSCSKP
jgi:hypothetical protein